MAAMLDSFGLQLGVYLALAILDRRLRYLSPPWLSYNPNHLPNPASAVGTGNAREPPDPGPEGRAAPPSSSHRSPGACRPGSPSSPSADSPRADQPGAASGSVQHRSRGGTRHSDWLGPGVRLRLPGYCPVRPAVPPPVTRQSK